MTAITRRVLLAAAASISTGVAEAAPVEPVVVVIGGEGVGKSALVDCITGAASDDEHLAPLRICRGMGVEFHDTCADARLSRLRAISYEVAIIVLHVSDATGREVGDTSLLELGHARWRELPILRVVNKIDLVSREKRRVLSGSGVLACSAFTREGIGTLVDAICSSTAR